MPDSPTKLQRWLDLIAYLVGRRLPVAVDELMEKVPAYAVRWRTGDATARASVRRTFERDKEELRRAGIPLRTVRYTLSHSGEEVEGYRIDRRDFYLPYIRLVRGGRRGTKTRTDRAAIGEVAVEEEDLMRAVRALDRFASLPSFPLAADARAALRKLTFNLGGGTGGGGGPASVLFVEPPGAAELREPLRVLSDALLQRKRVRFRYHGLYRDEETSREVAPYGLYLFGGHWYLIGHDALRDAVRVFRVGRMQDVAMNTRKPQTPDYRIPEDFDIDAFVGRRAWELGDPGAPYVEAQVLFRFPLSITAARHGWGRLLARNDDGSAVRALDVQQTGPFLRWILGLEGEAALREPPAMVAALREMAARVADLHHDTTREPAGGPEARHD
jgi:predicted DNA-binding transcriptional regulator YafY